jgi:alanine racemase
MIEISAPHRLQLDSNALVANWRWLAKKSGAAATGAAIKADGYGLGARAVMDRLYAAGCRDFFVATWREAAALMPLPPGAALSVLHGVRAEDMAAALTLSARPVLNSVEQVRRWRDYGEGRACDVMVDTGINRLGLSIAEAMGGACDGLRIETLMSHLARADEDSAMNAQQLAQFVALRECIAARRYSLANSAGICLGREFGFDLTRPGLALYGGIPCKVAEPHIRPVVSIAAQLLQVHMVAAGDSVGYGAEWTAARDTPVGVVNLGYADGFWRALRVCAAQAGGSVLPILGRISMDLITLDLSAAGGLAPGDWVLFDWPLSALAGVSGLGQYELLTGLGTRLDRCWSV